MKPGQVKGLIRRLRSQIEDLEPYTDYSEVRAEVRYLRRWIEDMKAKLRET